MTIKKNLVLIIITCFLLQQPLVKGISPQKKQAITLAVGALCALGYYLFNAPHRDQNKQVEKEKPNKKDRVKKSLLFGTLASCATLTLLRSSQKQATPQEHRAQKKDTVDLVTVNNIKMIQQAQTNALKQPNDWECGYYASFHALQIRRQLNKQTESITNASRDAYEKWTRALPDIIEKLKKREKLGKYTIEKLISEEESSHEMPHDVCILEENNLDITLPQEARVLNALAWHRTNKDKPFFILACDKQAAHWFTIVIYNNCCYTIDSLNSERPGGYEITKKITRLVAQTTFPSGDEYATVRKALRKACKQDKQAIEHIKYNALTQYHFTEETFAQLQKHLTGT